ncbi:MAG: glycosyltransferase family 2 protein [Paludibacteraceae bacterium]|nr:glycosyltransferase family 2 protein [Paludibacteraceae bacterium]
MKRFDSNFSLSICIPVYNWDVTKLVTELHRQAENAPFNVEILVFDDKSEIEFRNINSSISSLKSVSYKELEENAGRSKIRNALVEAAKSQYVLLMDCDAEVTSCDFIEKYAEAADFDVVVGGTAYHTNPPEPQYILRWKYGTEREMRNAETRQKSPNSSFTPFNFMIRKEIFSTLNFNENICGYGHEDTLFGWNLKQKSIEVKHIDNPLIHIGLDKTDVFLSKTKESVRNIKLISDNLNDRNFDDDVALLRCLRRIEKYKIKQIVKISLNLLYPFLLKNLKSDKPNIRCFDLFKLKHLLSL